MNGESTRFSVQLETVAADKEWTGARLGCLRNGDTSVCLWTPTWVLPTVRGAVPAVNNDVVRGEAFAFVNRSDKSMTTKGFAVGDGVIDDLCESSMDESWRPLFQLGLLDFIAMKGVNGPGGAETLRAATSASGGGAREFCNLNGLAPSLLLSIRSTLCPFDFIEDDAQPRVLQEETSGARCLRGDARGTRVLAGSESVLELQQAARCEFYESLYEPVVAPPHSSIAPTRAVDRTIHWAEEMLRSARERDTPGKMVLSVTGGACIAERQRCATAMMQLALQRPGQVGGFNVVGLGLGNESPAEGHAAVVAVAQQVRQSIPHLPLFATGGGGTYATGSPLQVLRLIAAGVDVVESRYPLVLAEYGIALDLFGESVEDGETDAPPYAGQLHLRSLRNARDARPILLTRRDAHSARCCTVGREHSRAYLHHLLKVHEMLGSMLLTLHNLQQYCALFAAIRHSLRHGDFNAFYQRVADAHRRGLR